MDTLTLQNCIPFLFFSPSLSVIIITCLLFSCQTLILVIFSRWIIGYKNLLRAVEFSGVAGILGLEYLSAGNLSDSKYQNFLKSEALRREYLNQSFNFLPFLEVRF